jgi:nondiscriminating aspartyl-tRNA synthetase
MNENRILIRDLKENNEKKVTIQGFIYKKRDVSNKLTFLILRDRSGLVQCVIENSEEILKIKGLQNGSILSINGQCKLEARAVGGVEIHQPSITIINPIKEISPIEIDKDINHNSENFDTLFEYRVLNLRNIKEQKIFKIRAEIKDLIRKFLKEEDFTEFDSPKLLSGATEGGAEVFTLDYFGKTAALAQSAQFYKQILVGVFERVFEINPTYRAEPSFTPRHMTEFMHFDLEMGFVEDLEVLLNLTERLLNFVIENIWQTNEQDLLALGATKPLLIASYPRISLKKLFELYKQETGIDDSKEKDPSPVHERFISDYCLTHFNCEAVFITDFPSSEMKFYHKIDDNNPEVCHRSDLIFRGVELATVPLREHRYDILLKQMISAGLDPEDVGNKYYLMAFKHGLPPHGGFGMGFDRLVQKIIGLSSVKEATLFPRDVNRLAP